MAGLHIKTLPYLYRVSLMTRFCQLMSRYLMRITIQLIINSLMSHGKVSHITAPLVSLVLLDPLDRAAPVLYSLSIPLILATCLPSTQVVPAQLYRVRLYKVQLI